MLKLYQTKIGSYLIDRNSIMIELGKDDINALCWGFLNSPALETNSCKDLVAFFVKLQNDLIPPE